MAIWRVWQLLPKTDTAGRAILCHHPARRNLNAYSMEQETKALFYLLDVISQDEDLRHRGFVCIGDGRVERNQYAHRKYRQWAPTCVVSFPTRLRAIHACHPSPWLFYIVFPVMKYFMGKELRLRMVLHLGSTKEVLLSLQQYSLTLDTLPAELGGNVQLDFTYMNKFIMERMVLELPKSLAQRENTSTDATRNSGNAGTKSIPENISSGKQSSELDLSSLNHNDEAEASMAMLEGEHADVQVNQTNSQKKRRPSPILGDARMRKALEAKEANPGLSLYDALLVGGYEFTKVDPHNENTWVDADGVGLRQRKNNLCRRVRLSKKAREQKQNETQLHKNVAAKGHETPAGQADFTSASEIGPIRQQKQQHVTRCDSFDSFDEAIGELPGLDESSNIQL